MSRVRQALDCLVNASSFDNARYLAPAIWVILGVGVTIVAACPGGGLFGLIHLLLQLEIRHHT